MVSVHDVANYFLVLTDFQAGEVITHLKLQKLVYYAQGFHLAVFDAPLFSERIEAWRHGPVVPVLYHALKENKDDVLPPPEYFEPDDVLAQPQQVLLDDVYSVYGQFSAWKLREMTHEEAPWRDADARGPNEEITHEALRRFFVTRIT
jgi:uncharacterized phage-associated protein